MQERSRKEKNILYIVVPCYNEEQVLAETSKRLKEKCEMLIHDGKIAKESRIVFVDDGSKDHTWNMIDEFHKMDSIFFRSEIIQKSWASKCITGWFDNGIRESRYCNINGCGSSGRYQCS